jgi:formylmethanofuran--tetrahydromethanopterin N-formyltransferase
MPELNPFTRLFRKKEGAPEVPSMIRNGVRIDDSFAEAFGMTGSGVIITAPTLKWAMHSAMAMTGFGNSVIGCGCEAGIDRELTPDETPDGRPGVRALLFGFSPADVEARMNDRVGMSVLTSPGSACYSGLDGGQRINLGANMRYFGDGHQISKVIGGRRYWRVPVMEGEFVCEDTTGVTTDSVGGGNLLIMGRTVGETLAAAEVAVEAMKKVHGVIMPFPGGVVRSGSKVGSVYKSMSASTNDAYCPTLRGKVKTALDPDIGSVQEIVIDGLTSDAVAQATRVGLAALINIGPKGGVLRIGAGNYGGKLGQFHYHLKDLLP